MRSNLLGLYLAVAAVGFVPVSDATASGGFFTRGCAARDMQILMMIEHSAGTGNISAQHLDDAVRTMMHARMVCFEGHIGEALALYDDIAQSVSSDWASSRPSRIR